MDVDKQKMSKYMATAIGAARVAGAEALSQMQNIQCHLKNADEVVTQADPICQKLIIDYISRQYPTHGFLAEESLDKSRIGEPFKKTPSASQQLWWIIDPIDGTNNYSHRVLDFSVSVGLFGDGMPLLGVIYIPASDTLFTGIVGQQAHCNGNIITCGDEVVNYRESVAIDSYWDNGIPDKLMKLIDASRMRNLGSTAMHLAYVASGGFVGAVVNRNKLWDLAAGAAILSAAGAIITTHDGKPLLPIDVAGYNAENLAYIAANPAAHKQLLESLS